MHDMWLFLRHSVGCFPGVDAPFRLPLSLALEVGGIGPTTLALALFYRVLPWLAGRGASGHNVLWPGTSLPHQLSIDCCKDRL